MLALAGGAAPLRLLLLPPLGTSTLSTPMILCKYMSSDKSSY
jgi:hypothetical protein